MYRCIECGLEKRKTEFHKVKNRLGHRYKCKDCVNEYMRKRHVPVQLNPDKALKNGKAKCSECKKWKPVVMFYSSKSKRGCQSKCRLCQKAYQKSLNMKNGVKNRTPKKEYGPCLGYCQRWYWFPIGTHVCYHCGVKQMGVRETIRH